MAQYKIVYKDYGDPDRTGSWRIFVRRWWGWKNTEVYCHKKGDVDVVIKRMEENPVRYIDGATLQ